MAWPMSPTWAPGLATAMPRIIASWVTSHRRLAFTPTLPAKNMRLVSPYQPSRMVVTSMFTMSPSCRRFSPGMPWQTTWLIEVQIDFGKPR